MAYEPNASCSSGILARPSNDPAQSIGMVSAAERGGYGSSSSRHDRGGGGGDVDSGFVGLGSVSQMRRNHGTTKELSDSSGARGFVAYAPQPSNTPKINIEVAHVPDYADPLSFFLINGKNGHDPFDFGLGSVADGTFGGKPPTFEQLLLFRSHRLMQAHAVFVAMSDAYSLSASTRQRFSDIGGDLVRKVWAKLLEQTNSCIEHVRALGKVGGIPHGKKEDIIKEKRNSCHRMITGILDSTTRELREILDMDIRYDGSGGSGTDSSFSSSKGSRSDTINTDRIIFSTATLEPAKFGSETRDKTPLSLSMARSPLPSESHQVVANSNNWEGAMNTTSITMSSLASNPGVALPPVPQPQLEQQPTIQSHGGIDRSSVFALTHERDRSQRYSPLGAQIDLSNSMGRGVDERHSTTAGTSYFRGPLGQVGKRGDRQVGEFNAGGSAVPEASMSLNHGGKAAPLAIETWNVAWGAASHTGSAGGGKAKSNSFKTALVEKNRSKRGTWRGNRRGSRHRLTPQAKEILEAWLTKHWVNPYPTEDEKLSLSQACGITVIQVNNWMMNVRVRRCRTKKIGVANDPDQLPPTVTYPSNGPSAIARSNSKGP